MKTELGILYFYLLKRIDTDNECLLTEGYDSLDVQDEQSAESVLPHRFLACKLGESECHMGKSDTRGKADGGGRAK